MSTDRAVRRAKQALQRAQHEEHRLQAAVVDGDDTITAADLAEAEAAVRLAALRVQAAQRIVAEEANDKQARAQAQRLKRAERAKAEQRRQERESWQRSIDSGQAARLIADLRLSGPSRPRFDPEYDDMLVEAGLLPPKEPTG